MEVLFIGGPKHGERIRTPGRSAVLNFAEMEPMSWTREMPLDAIYPSYKTISCPIREIAIGPNHRRYIGVAPGISNKTAESYFYDVLVDAYDRHARKL